MHTPSRPNATGGGEIGHMLDKLNTFALSLFARMQIVRSEAGQAMVEYTLIVALLSIVAIVLIKTVGGDITEAWKTIETEF